MGLDTLGAYPGVSLYRHVPHPHIARRNAAGPVKVADQHPRGSAMARFNARAAVAVTKVVGSMWCAYAFGAFDLISLPDAIKGGTPTIISWVAQTFLQLVLLSVIMVGQDVQAAAADKRSEQEFGDVEALLHGQGEQATHLGAQDDKIIAILEQLQANTALTETISLMLATTRKED